MPTLVAISSTEDTELLYLHLAGLTQADKSWPFERTFQKGLTSSLCQ